MSLKLLGETGTRICGGASGNGNGSVRLGALLLDSEDGGRQLPKTASRNADAVGDGIEYSETDIDGRPEGTE